MPTITVSALITDGHSLLLARPAGSELMTLPGGRLTDADESVEDALVRVLSEVAGLRVGEPEFLDTLYERLPDEVVVHNVFAVPATAGAGQIAGRGAELRWVPIKELGE